MSRKLMIFLLASMVMRSPFSLKHEDPQAILFGRCWKPSLLQTPFVIIAQDYENVLNSIN